jgi:LAS superfamily LD-carboxypeptidase LdcB
MSLMVSLKQLPLKRDGKFGVSKLRQLGKVELVGQLSDPKSELRTSLTRLDEAMRALYKERQLTPTTELDLLLSNLDEYSRMLLQDINQLGPSEYGISTPSYEGLEPVPDTIEVEFVSAVEKDEEGNFKKSYQRVPIHVHAAFEPMNEAFIAEYPERRLKIVSGYRSPAFQLYTFVRILVHINDFDIVKTFKRVMLPAYSQHCLAKHTALDVANVDGKPSEKDPSDFEGTVECIWLREHAAKFGFHESYTQDNEHGIMPEPWHWQYKGLPV